MTPELLSLDTHVDRLVAFCESVASPLPRWRDRLLLDTAHAGVSYLPGPHPRWLLPAEALRPVRLFAPRFDGLLRAGYSWINLSAYGLFRDDLIVGIELPSEPTGVPPGFTAVNYSGPPLDAHGQPRWVLNLVLGA